MRLFSYVVARDFAFAPNPFYGFCTLATCKPDIRRTAQVGDWIIGTGSKRQSRDGHLVYVMQVTETMTFDDYWADARFELKRPNMQASRKRAFGDNIYHHSRNGSWRQENSHHSLRDGSPNPENVDHDTRVDRVLISDHFTYWGGDGPEIPPHFRDFDGVDACLGRQGHRCRFPEPFVDGLVAWLGVQGMSGYAGRPQDW